MSKEKHVDPIPEEFASYEEAAEFWDSRDTTDYPDIFRTVEVKTEFRDRHYEIDLEEEVVRKLQAQARQRGVTVSRLASDLLRQQLAAYLRAERRPRLGPGDRAFWILVRRFWAEWTHILLAVKPATVIAWHRTGFRAIWRWKSRPGRP